MTSVSVFDIIENVSHSLDYAYVYGRACPDIDTIHEMISDEIHSLLIYESDISDTWDSLGWPTVPLTGFDSPLEALTWTVYETLRTGITVQDIVDEFTDSFDVDDENKRREWLKPLTDEIA